MRIKPLRAFVIGWVAVFLGALLKIMKFEQSVYFLSIGTIIQLGVIIYVLNNYILIRKVEKKS